MKYKVYRLQSLAYLTLLNVCSIIIHIIILCLFPIYFIGAFFWTDRQFYDVMTKVYNSLTKPFE